MRSMIAILFGCALAACGPATTTSTTEPAAPANALLAHFAGNQEGAFAVAGEAMMSPAAPPVEFTGTENLWRADDGSLRVVYAQAATENTPAMNGWGTLSWDAAAAKVKMTWVDSMVPGHTMLAEGTFQADDALVLDGDDTTPDGQPVRFRTIYRFPTADSREFEMGMVAPDGTYTAMMHYTSLRSGDATKTWEPPAAPPETPAPPAATGTTP